MAAITVNNALSIRFLSSLIPVLFSVAVHHSPINALCRPAGKRQAERLTARGALLDAHRSDRCSRGGSDQSGHDPVLQEFDAQEHVVRLEVLAPVTASTMQKIAVLEDRSSLLGRR